MFTLLLALVYLAAVNLGLQGSLLGVSWPVLHGEIGADISSLGIITFCTTCFSILVSFFSGKIIKAFGHGKILTFSLTLTASALLAISFTQNLYLLIPFSILLGVGGSFVDATINNYAARNCSSRQMNFLHCFWGLGAAAGSILMSAFLAAAGWRWGYRVIALIQAVSFLILFIFLPLWGKGGKLRRLLPPVLIKDGEEKEKGAQNAFEQGIDLKEGAEQTFSCQRGLNGFGENNNNLLDEGNVNGARQVGEGESDFNKGAKEQNDCQRGLKELGAEQREGADGLKGEAKEKKSAKERGFFTVFKEKGVVLSLFSFFFYCGIDSSAGNWGATYLVSSVNFTPQGAAGIISFYYMGVTAGRLLSALVSNKTRDKTLIAVGTATLFIGIFLLALSKNTALSISGYLLIGLGLAPIFPSMVHLTPSRFDQSISSDMIGYQIAFASIGAGTLSPLIGFILKSAGFVYFPYVLAFLCVLFAAFQFALDKTLARGKKLTL